MGKCSSVSFLLLCLNVFPLWVPQNRFAFSMPASLEAIPHILKPAPLWCRRCLSEGLCHRCPPPGAVPRCEPQIPAGTLRPGMSANVINK